jgi:hypothetical protein
MRFSDLKSKIRIRKSQIANPTLEPANPKSQSTKGRSQILISTLQIPFTDSQIPNPKSQIPFTDFPRTNLKSQFSNRKSQSPDLVLHVTWRGLPLEFRNPKSKKQIAFRNLQIANRLATSAYTEVVMRLFGWFRGRKSKSQISNLKCPECGWGKGTHWLYCDRCLADVVSSPRARAAMSHDASEDERDD